jgi:hypothetical protein
MAAICCSQKSGSFWTTLLHSEDHTLHSCCCKNPKSNF